MSLYRRLIQILVLLALTGCQVLRPTPLVGVGRDAAVTSVQAVSDRSVHGRVDFTGGRTTQSTPADVVNAATVSFIDTGTNQTVATSKTDAAGSFALTLGSYAPVNGGTYLLEAVKGLNSQAPGSDAARFRTVLQWDGTGWLSCTNGSIPGTIVINALTTALAIETALDPGNVPAASTIGKVNVATSPATLNAPPGPYTNHPDSEISQLASDLLSYLGVDTDPLASVPAIAPTISSFQPASAAANSLVRIVGAGFSPALSGNTVTFNGKGAQVLLATPTSLVVVVPSGATSGPLRVVTGRGAVNSGSGFTVRSDLSDFMIVGFSPAIARAEDTVTLSGQFGTVDGVVALNALRCATVSVSPTAISVKLPFGAASGPLSYQLGASTVTSAQVLTVKKGEVGAWVDQSTASLIPTARFSSAAVDYNGSVYLVGGWDSAGNKGTDVILRARYLADGTLSAWEAAGVYSSIIAAHSAFVRNGFLYVVGGCDPSTQVARVDRAPIKADGTLGTFVSAGNLNTRRYWHATALVNDRLYVIGGYNSTDGYLSSVECGTFDGVGNLTFTNAGTVTVGATTYAHYAPAVAVAGNTILLFGGLIGGGYTAESKKVLRIPVNANGTLGVMSYSAQQLPEQKSHIFAATANGKVYIPGGEYSYTDGGGGHYVNYRTVQVATLDAAAGDIGPITTYSGRLVTGRYGAPSVFNNGRLYVLGGEWATDTAVRTSLRSVEVLNVLNDGSVDYGQAQGAIQPRYAHETVQVGNSAYLLGGLSSQLGTVLRQVERVTLNADGTLTAPRVVSNLTVPREALGAVVIGNYLYALGGFGSSGALTSIERAQFDTDGSLGGFVPVSTILPQPLAGLTVARIRNWLYLFGGDVTAGGGVAIPHSWRAPINADDSLGAFQAVTAATLPISIGYAKAEVIGDYLYLIGGLTTGTPYRHIADVYRARIAPDGSISGFQKWHSLSVPRFWPVGALIGSYYYVFGGWGWNNLAGMPALATSERAPVTANGELGPWEPATPLLTARGHASVLMFGDRVVVMGGLDGALSMGSIEAAQVD